MKALLKLVLIVLLVATIAVWFLFYRQKPIKLPPTESVVSISASFQDLDSGKEISEFTAPESHHGKILDLFRDAKSDPSPAKWQTLGTIEIETKQGTQTISLFQTGESSGAFRTSPNSYYRGSSDKAIISAIEAAKKDSK